MKKSALSIGALTLVCFSLHYSLYAVLSLPFKPEMLLAYAYMSSTALFFEYVFHRDRDPKMFINLYMGFSGGKMMFSLFVILVYGLIRKPYLWHFTLGFLALYFIFTAFEITRLLRYLKK